VFVVLCRGNRIHAINGSDIPGGKGAGMTTGILIVVIIVLVLLVVAAFFFGQQRRTQRLQERFGPEYRRTVARTGDRRTAESDLAGREERRGELNIVELEPPVRDRYVQAWQATQNKFVDDPEAATRDADVLVTKVMRDRGYPVDDFDRRADDVSVDHPEVAENYRNAHALTEANRQGLTSTDDLRQAFVYYRSLFAELLDGDRGDKEVR
jgi:hypothetical protein